MHALQDQISVVPLSSYGKPYTPPPATVDPAIDMKAAPRDQVNALDGAAYFKLFAELMKANHSIKDLDLSSNMIIMEELQILADAFKESSVECLNLRNNLISSEEILAFDSVLAFVANLPKRKFLF